MTIKIRVRAAKRMESAGRAGWQERFGAHARIF